MTEQKLVPADVIAFLMGEGPMDDLWFGETKPIMNGKYQAAFWWRDRLRDLPSAPPAPSGRRSDDLRPLVEAVEDFINVPRTGGETSEVRTYRHGLYPVWERLRDALIAAPSPDTGKMGGDGDWASIAAWMGFAASVIKSGEPWTDQCQREFDEAKRAFERLNRAPVSGGEGEAVAWVYRRKFPGVICTERRLSFRHPDYEDAEDIQPLYAHPSDPSATERMRAALEPFANAAADFDGWPLKTPLPADVLTIGDLAQARAALGEA